MWKLLSFFDTKVVAISARNTIISRTWKLCKAMLSTHYNIFQLNFGILLLLKGSFREFRGVLLDQTLVYNANCTLEFFLCLRYFIWKRQKSFWNTFQTGRYPLRSGETVARDLVRHPGHQTLNRLQRILKMGRCSHTFGNPVSYH